MNPTTASDPVLPEVLERALALGGSLLDPAPDAPSGPTPLASLVGTLGGSRPAAFALEAVREGFLCHHGSSRILDLEDRDLALLVGDLFYAIGLRELALAGSPEPVATLADLIRLVSERAGRGPAPVVEALWLGQAVALGIGTDDGHAAAIEAIESGEDAAAERLSEWTAGAVARAGAGEGFSAAAQALQ